MADVRIPHFDLPFRFVGGKAVVNEQDSNADVGVCVETVVRYRKGQRFSAPRFGIIDPTFSQSPLDGAALIATIEEQEPRARPALIAAEDEIDRAQSLAEGVDIVRFALGVQQ